MNTNALLSASFVHFQFSGISIVFTYCVPVVSTFESLFVEWNHVVIKKHAIYLRVFRILLCSLGMWAF